MLYSHDASGGERLTPSETATAANGHSGNTLPAVVAPADALEMPGFHAWWREAPGAPPWVQKPRKSYELLREFLTEAPAWVTMYQSDRSISKRFDRTLDEATGKWILQSPKTQASITKATAHKVPVYSLKDFMDFRAELSDCNALSYGVFAKDDVHIRTEASAAQYEGVCARSRAFMSWLPGPGIMACDADLLDDQNVTPHDIDALLSSKLAWWRDTARLWDWSCSAGIECADTGEMLKPHKNCRAWMMVDDARAIWRLQMEMHEVFWKAGIARAKLTRAGVKNSAIFDLSMAQPERLDFQVPDLGEGLRRAARPGYPLLIEGKDRLLTTAGKGLDLTLDEFHQQSAEWKAAREQMKPQEAAYKERLVAEAVEKARAEGRDETAARERAERLYNGERKTLIDSDELVIHDGSIITVGEVRANPEKYDGARCADPAEPDYRGDMRIAQINPFGRIGPHIYSHAHGEQIYMLPREPADLFPGLEPAPSMSAEAQAALAAATEALTRRAAEPRFNPDGTLNTAYVEDVPPFQQLLPETLLPVAPFENDLLPDPLQGWARDTVDRMQCPADFIGAALMVALGSVIGAKVVIRPKQNDDKWSEAPNNYGGLIGQPSSKKSPAMAAAMAFVNKLEALAAARHKEALLHYKAKKQLAEVHVKRSKASAVTRVSDAVEPDWDHEARTYADDLKLLDDEEPSPRRYLASDINPASLGEIVRRNPDRTGVLIARDELQGLLQAFEHDDTSALRPMFLEGWKGLNPHRIDRISRGYIYIPTLCISVFGTIQPGVIAPHIRAAQEEGKGADGLLQRFQFLVWPELPKTWKRVDRKADRTLEAKAFEVFEMLDRLTPEACGAQTDEPDGRPYLRFSLEAQAVFDAWQEGLEKAMRGRDDLSALDSHVYKYPALVASVALICHLAEGGKGAVSKAALDKALRWAAYLETHACRIYGSGPLAVTLAAKSILKLAKDGRLPKADFTARQVHRKGRAQIGKAAIVEEALELLEEYGWVGSVEKPTGGRPKTVYWFREA